MSLFSLIYKLSKIEIFVLFIRNKSWLSFMHHTVNSGSEMVEAKHVSGKNIFWSTLTVKSRGGKIFEFLHCPFEGRANMHHKIQPNWLTGRCCLAGGSKGQCRKSKIFLSLLLPMQVDQYIFFPETCFAPTISEPELTVCLGTNFLDRGSSCTFDTFSILVYSFKYKGSSDSTDSISAVLGTIRRG